MSLPLRSLTVFTLASALLLAVASPGCSRQGEGERCDTTNGDSDCDDGLKCVGDNKLLQSGGSDRCCNPDLTSFNDSRCEPGSGSGNEGGSGSTEGGGPSGPTGGVPAAAGGADAGTAGVPATPDEAGGAGGNPSTGGVPATEPEAGASSGGVPATPAGGQGGAD